MKTIKFVEPQNRLSQQRKQEPTPGEQAMAEQEKQYQSFRENHDGEDDRHFDYREEE